MNRGNLDDNGQDKCPTAMGAGTRCSPWRLAHVHEAMTCLKHGNATSLSSCMSTRTMTLLLLRCCLNPMVKVECGQFTSCHFHSCSTKPTGRSTTDVKCHLELPGIHPSMNVARHGRCRKPISIIYRLLNFGFPHIGCALVMQSVGSDMWV